MDTTIVRLAGDADMGGMVRLLGLLFAQEKEFEPSAAAQESGLRAILASPAIGRLLVAAAGDRIAGMVSLLYTLSTALGGRVALLEDMIVAPDARGSGIGTRLVEAAIGQARRDGCLRITLLTDGDNTRAHRFYEKAGFGRSSMTVYRLPLPGGKGRKNLD